MPPIDSQAPNPEQPDDLVQAAQEVLNLPGVAATGVTKTLANEWALKIWLERMPVPRIGEFVRGHPVLYVTDEALPAIQPAYPEPPAAEEQRYRELSKSSELRIWFLRRLAAALIAASIFLIGITATMWQAATRARREVADMAPRLVSAESKLDQTEKLLKETQEVLSLRTNREQWYDPTQREKLYTQALQVFSQLKTSSFSAPRLKFSSPIMPQRSSYSEPIVLAAKLWAKVRASQKEYDPAADRTTFANLRNLEALKGKTVDINIETARPAFVYLFARNSDDRITLLSPREPLTQMRVNPGRTETIATLANTAFEPRISSLMLVQSQRSIEFDPENPSPRLSGIAMGSLSDPAQRRTIEQEARLGIWGIDSGRLVSADEIDEVAIILLSPLDTGFAEIPMN